MRIDQLIYLIEVSRLESITLAAEQLHVSQPTISQAINSLEKELGNTIFYRSRLGTKPTEYGKEVIERARDIVNKIEEIKELADNDITQLTGNLSMTAVPGFCMSILPDILVHFKKKFPNITLKIYEGGTFDIEKDVMNEKIDLGFVAVNNQEYYKSNDSLLFEQLTSGKIMACVGQKSSLATKSSLTFKEIVQHPIISLKPGFQMYKKITNELKKYGEPNLLFYSGNTAAGKQILTEGIGVGFCSNETIKNDPYFTFDRLVPIPLCEQDINLYYGYIRLKNKHFPKVAKEFIKTLKVNI